MGLIVGGVLFTSPPDLEQLEIGKWRLSEPADDVEPAAGKVSFVNTTDGSVLVCSHRLASMLVEAQHVYSRTRTYVSYMEMWLSRAARINDKDYIETVWEGSAEARLMRDEINHYKKLAGIFFASNAIAVLALWATLIAPTYRYIASFF